MNGESRDMPGLRPVVDPSTTDRGSLARQRHAAAQVRRLEEHRRVCRELEQLGSLATYYGPRPLRAVPLAQFLAEGWWAA